ncbi:hypothetical protein CcI49_03015 [Frankia sp. CcI49]|nr:hypothetical protein CcI49_03015 [Frankia sp. CcI49]
MVRREGAVSASSSLLPLVRLVRGRVRRPRVRGVSGFAGAVVCGGARDLPARRVTVWASVGVASWAGVWTCRAGRVLEVRVRPSDDGRACVWRVDRGVPGREVLMGWRDVDALAHPMAGGA